MSNTLERVQSPMSKVQSRVAGLGQFNGRFQRPKHPVRSQVLRWLRKLCLYDFGLWTLDIGLSIDIFRTRWPEIS